MIPEKKARNYRDPAIAIIIGSSLVIQLLIDQFLWPVVISILVLQIFLRSKEYRKVCLLTAMIIYVIHYECWHAKTDGEFLT